MAKIKSYFLKRKFEKMLLKKLIETANVSKFSELGGDDDDRKPIEPMTIMILDTIPAEKEVITITD